jgi:small subunit ribosomal protein S7
MRKAQAKKLPVATDGRYNYVMVSRFINNIMWNGKKSTAINIFYYAIDKASKLTN